jgi:hypothetical protein
MKNDELNKYLPTEETIRRVTDRSLSEENRRRTLENPQLREAMTQREPKPAVPQVPGATPAGSAVEGAASAVRNRRLQSGVMLGAVLAVLAPALLVYWLLVPRGPQGTIEKEAGAAAAPFPSASAPSPLGASTAAAVSAPSPLSAPMASSAGAPRAGPAPGQTRQPPAPLGRGEAPPVRATAPTGTGRAASPMRPSQGAANPDDEIFHRPK